MTFVSRFEPKELWQHFDKILTIPRGSKNEAAMREYIIAIAQKHNLSYQQDAAGNVVVSKPGSKGKGSAPVTILQSHLDMVNDKNADVQHDFTKDAIQPRQDGDYLYATGTTLGSDNGIGVAAALAILESKTIEHGPLELLFTIDEETGLTGAGNLSGDLLKGRQLINLDTEEEGSLYVGCAGGAGVNLTIPLKFSNVASGAGAFDIKLHGLRGGHSGVDIHLQRGNAVKLLARALNSVHRKVKFQLASLTGGNMHNAIPREAFAKVTVASSEKEKFQKELHQRFQEIYSEFKSADPEMKITIAETDSIKKTCDDDTTFKVINLLNALPHGVASMSYDIPGLVETSSNLATVKINDSQMVVHVSNRSSVASAIRATQERVASIGELAGAIVEELEGYPGWKPNMDSHVLQVSKKVHQKLLGKEPQIKAIHAGLECGIIGEKVPGMDMVSLGPQIEFPHSPNERVRIGSVSDFYKLLIGVLKELANTQ
ncbi:MAG TPA: aminoacyl-histidine dipeptidase [bacterium]